MCAMQLQSIVRINNLIGLNMAPLLCFFQLKSLRRLIQQTFKQFAVLSEKDCVFRFFETLSKVWRFDQEQLKCALGVS